MAVSIRVPDLGTTVDEIKLVSWLIREGDLVRRGDFLAEMETDKATTELESVAEGVLLKQAVGAGETVRVGDVIAYVGTPGESVPDVGAEAASEGDVSKPSGPAQAAAQPSRVSPVVANLAKKMGVDLSSVQGTGQGGMITRADVLRVGKAAATDYDSLAGETLSRSQAGVAKAVVMSCREIPHLRVTAQLDMTGVEALRAASEKAGKKLSYDAIFLKALAGAIQEVPILASRLAGELVIRPKGMHIALAIGFENELFLPVIRDVDRKTLSTLQTEIENLASQAKAGVLRSEWMTGGCMALSNLGMYPIESFDAIIFPEHSAILSLGAVCKKAVAVGERVEVRPVAVVKLAVDHRLVNGRAAAKFLAEVKRIVESGGRDQLLTL